MYELKETLLKTLSQEKIYIHTNSSWIRILKTAVYYVLSMYFLYTAVFLAYYWCMGYAGNAIKCHFERILSKIK